MKVWVLLRDTEEDINGGEYSTYHNDELLGVFATKFLAEQAANKWGAHPRGDIQELKVQEWVVLGTEGV
jgi:hypothetical protein